MGIRRNWPVWCGYLAAAWSLAYGLLGVYWAAGGAGYPFAKVDEDHATASLLEGSPVDVVAPAIAVVGLAGAVIAVLMTRHEPSGWSKRPLLVFASVLAIALALLIPDYTLLAIVALSPALLVFTRRHPDPWPGAPLGSGLPALDLVQGRPAGAAVPGDRARLDRGDGADPSRADESAAAGRQLWLRMGPGRTGHTMGDLGRCTGRSHLRLPPATPYDVPPVRTWH